MPTALRHPTRTTLGSTEILLSFLDATFGGAPTAGNPSDLSLRPWFGLFQQTFDRWEALGGIDYRYEPNDDGASLGIFSGSLGVRGDVRIGGRNIDGAGNTLAFNFLPDNGDMVIDTSEALFFGNSSNNSRALRNTVAHEAGHGFGMEHVVSSTDALLLEPSIGLSFDGPQLDEVRAVHFFYGDVLEKSNNGLGNGIAARATDLGSLTQGSTTSIGTDANVPSQAISPTATDFVSISNVSDIDFFSFTISEPGQLDALLTPLGGTFSQGGTAAFDASARSDLALTIFDTDGITPLVSIDNVGQGAIESLENFSLFNPGEYFARVTGADDTIQLYQLDLSVNSPPFLEADFNEDYLVDSTDLTILEAALGLSPAGDTDGDGDTDGADFLAWQRQFNTPGAQGQVASQTIPEPTSVALLLLGLATRLCLIRVRTTDFQKRVDTSAPR